MPRRRGRVWLRPPARPLERVARVPYRGDGRGNMPASDTFARLGLVAAVTVVVGISTLGPLLRQGPQPEGRLVALAAVVPPAPSFASMLSDRSTGLAVAESSMPAARAVTPAALAPVKTGLAALTLEDPLPAAAKANPVEAIAAPVESASAAADTNGAFPSVQTLDEVPAGQTAAQAAAVAAAAAAAAKKTKRAAEIRAAKRKAAARPQPFDIRDFFAGRL